MNTEPPPPEIDSDVNVCALNVKKKKNRNQNLNTHNVFVHVFKSQICTRLYRKSSTGVKWFFTYSTVNISLSLAQSQARMKERGAFESAHYCDTRAGFENNKNVNSKKKFCRIKVT